MIQAYKQAVKSYSNKIDSVHEKLKGIMLGGSQGKEDASKSFGEKKR